MVVNNQEHTKDYSLFCGDCCEVLPDLPDSTIGLSIFSPPFVSLYSYTDDARDMSNCKTYSEFFEHFEFLIKELFRLTMPGRIVAIHCSYLPIYKKDGEEMGFRDFPGDIIRAFQKQKFILHSPPFCIWKDPLLAAVRTKAIGLAHKQIVKDSAMCRMGVADYLIAFRKSGPNSTPINHPYGLTQYYGSHPVPVYLNKWIGFKGNQKLNKRSHWIWRQYASPVWLDIRQTYVLPCRKAKDSDDEKHLCPLQLDVIERCVALWSAPGDTLLTPFMGVGSEVYVAIKNRRKGIGIELKPSYYKQAVLNVKSAVRNRNQKDWMI